MLQASAVAQHEMYLAWVMAGFTTEQSMELVSTVIYAMIMKAA